ncbi:DUF349 domain-containing protein [Nostoc sp.]|uniref:DUF349 domain-containing protein n=1 Tax=Nostoc sp. TaxID=1180 RepID=UPI002FF5F7C5
MGEKLHLPYFDGPHGRIENLAIETCGKNHNELLLFPHWYNYQDNQQKGLHHHLFEDDRRSDIMALAYTTNLDATGKQVREYWIKDRNGWQLTDEYDFNRFIERMTSIVIGYAFREIEAKNRHKKEQLCSQAEALSASMDWRGAHEVIKSLRVEWEAVGSAGEDINQDLWIRFQSAVEKFYQRRTKHFEKLECQQQENRAKKEKLCNQAESLSFSTSWKETSESFKKLHEQWKQIGSAGRNYEDDLWRRFRSGQNKFYERRSAFYKQRDEEQLENLERKKNLCKMAELLVYKSDTRTATQTVKELQAEWKTIGYVPREQADEIWNRFQIACNRVFDLAKEERERKQSQWRSQMQETLNLKRAQVIKLRDSIEHDEGNTSRWRDTINNLRLGGRADQIRYELSNKIVDVENKICSKREHLYQLESSIREIESKLQ